MLMPAMLVGGHLLIAVADRLPRVDYEQTCREATTGELAASDKFSTCMGRRGQRLQSTRP
jgi:hypothetical protein